MTKSIDELLTPDPATRSGHEWQWKQLVEMTIINLEQRPFDILLWVSVGNVFGLGGSLAKQLCKRFGYDPYSVTGRHLKGADDE